MSLSASSAGQRLVLHLIDRGADVDLTSFGTKEMIFTKPDGTEVTVTDVTALNPPGTDGRLLYLMPGGFLMNGGTPFLGKWAVRAHIKVDADLDLYSVPVAFVPVD